MPAQLFSRVRRLGVLTGGGDVPGINAAIKALVYRAHDDDIGVLGLRGGWEGITFLDRFLGRDRLTFRFDMPETWQQGYIMPLTRLSTRTIDRQGGTILESTRANPANVKVANLPPHLWQIPWVVHITPWGEGQQAALDYLARYAFRIAITNNRILAVDDETVTYRYKDRAADRQRKETLTGHEFIRRFLQHVLPAGFHKVRYYGLWHASRREPLRNLRNLLLLAQPASPPAEPAGPEPDADPQAPPSPRRCPHCETGHLTLLRRLSPARPQGP